MTALLHAAHRLHAAQRQRGEIETPPSGSLRVYAGIDPLSGKRYHLIEVIPAGKDAAKLAEKAQRRLLNQIDEKRSPLTNATVAVCDFGTDSRHANPWAAHRYDQAIAHGHRHPTPSGSSPAPHYT